jgi:hypothetical protein
MLLIDRVKPILQQLADVVSLLQTESYTAKSNQLFGATIGQHVRHVIELFECLLSGYEIGIVNYENRERNLEIQNNKNFACSLLERIGEGINKKNKILMLQMDDSIEIIETNYNRELVYNLEHTIHHMALIRIGINEVTSLVVDDSFGVAPSTIKYKAACVQ